MRCRSSRAEPRTSVGSAGAGRITCDVIDQESGCGEARRGAARTGRARTRGSPHDDVGPRGGVPLENSYVETWNQSDPAALRAAVDELFSSDVRYVDPLVDVSGRAALVATIAAVHEPVPGVHLPAVRAGGWAPRPDPVRLGARSGLDGEAPIAGSMSPCAPTTPGRSGRCSAAWTALPGPDRSPVASRDGRLGGRAPRRHGAAQGRGGHVVREPRVDRARQGLRLGAAAAPRRRRGARRRRPGRPGAGRPGRRRGGEGGAGHRHPGVFFTTPHFEGYPAVLIRLDRTRGPSSPR